MYGNYRTTHRLKRFFRDVQANGCDNLLHRVDVKGEPLIAITMGAIPILRIFMHNLAFRNERIDDCPQRTARR